MFCCFRTQPYLFILSRFLIRVDFDPLIRKFCELLRFSYINSFFHTTQLVKRYLFSIEALSLEK